MNLIACPLKKEAEALIEGLEASSWVFEKQNFGHGNVWKDSQCKTFVAIGGHGKVEFALGTAQILNSLSDIKNVICAGTCGGIHDEIRPLDVVVGTETLEHDYKEKFSPASIPRFEGHAEFIEKAKQASSFDFKTYFGPIASGDEDILSSERSNQLWSEFNAHCVAWEGAGGARAAKKYQKTFLEIRGVSDLCTSETPSHFKDNLPQAMKNIALVINAIHMAQ